MVLERSEDLAGWTKHNLQETQGICPYISGRLSDRSTQLGYLSHLDSYYHSRSQKTTVPSSVDYVWKLCFYICTIQRICPFSGDFCFDSSDFNNNSYKIVQWIYDSFILYLHDILYIFIVYSLKLISYFLLYQCNVDISICLIN
jgi:hypothetical protein